ncbi:MAG: hypothetical protein J6X85_06450 [Ruminococcus sp.]|nr:hypothetical protein [Ruminococcus sp.]MBP5581410.1 hypothetical protein [Ruminococcus sp.]
MEKADIIAVVVVSVIAAAELFCLFICSKLKHKSYPLCIALPVTSEDDELPQRLEYIVSLIEEGSTFIGSILLIDIDGSKEQLQLCREFCALYHAMELTTAAELLNKLRTNM